MTEGGVQTLGRRDFITVKTGVEDLDPYYVILGRHPVVLEAGASELVLRMQRRHAHRPYGRVLKTGFDLRILDRKGEPLGGLSVLEDQE